MSCYQGLVMNFKNINLSKKKVAMTIIVSLVGGTVIEAVHGCSSQAKVNVADIDREIDAAQVSLDSVWGLYNAAVAKRDMYQHKYDSLFYAEVIGKQEKTEMHRQKVAEWGGYRDSVEKYNDEATAQSVARIHVQRQIDIMTQLRDRIK